MSRPDPPLRVWPHLGHLCARMGPCAVSRPRYTTRLRRGLAAAVVSLCVTASAGEAIVLENASLRVELRADTGAFDVLDRRCNHWWRQESPAAPRPPTPWVVRQRTQPVVVDGKLDEWPAAPAVTVSHTMTVDDIDVRDDADNSARVRFLWDTDALYVAAQVRDDKPALESRLKGEWESDCVELWIAFQHLGFFRRGGKDRVVCWTSRALAAQCRLAIQVTADGWDIEARVPLRGLPEFRNRLRHDGTLELAVGVDDTDDPNDPNGRQSQIFAPKSYKHSHPDTFAAGRLANADGVAKGEPALARPGFNGQRAVGVATKTSCVIDGMWRTHRGITFPMKLRFDLAPDAPDLKITLEAPPKTAFRQIDYPLPMAADGPDGVCLIPRNEGFMIPATSDDRPRLWGLFTTMPWIGVTHLKRGHGLIAIKETADDAGVRTAHAFGKLGVAPYWVSTKGKFGAPRRVLYSFCDKGRYVSLAKRYRRYAQKRGYFRTLKEKEKANPNVELLRGAVDIYGGYGATFYAFMKRLGIERALIHTGGMPANIDACNAAGYVSTKYDIYTDLYDPTTARGKWERCQFYKVPDDCIKRKDGSLDWGWCHERDKNGKVVNPSYLACASRRLWNMKRKIPADLEEHRYRGRFLDCTTASGLRECYDPNHPMTRGQDREWREKAFAYLVSLGLLPGSERGQWWAIPSICYMEGIQSTGNFRNTDIGRMPIDRKAYPNPEYLRTTLSPSHRLPLFELVFHECAINTWWWGDQSDRMPEIWARKDLIQILYGTIPLWYLTRKKQDFFCRNADRFARCYKNVCTWHRAVADDEMVDHRHLSDDLALQQSVFSSGLSVTANLGETPQTLPDGQVIPGFHYLLQGPAPKGIDLPIGRIVDPGVHWKPADTKTQLNPGFELGSMGWSPAAGMELREERTHVHSGACAMRVVGKAEQHYSFASGEWLPVSEGDRWQFSGWMKIDRIDHPTARPNFKFGLYAGRKYVTNRFTSKYDTSRLGTWQKLETTFTVPEARGINRACIALEKGTKEPAAADIVIDDVVRQLVKAKERKPLMPNLPELRKRSIVATGDPARFQRLFTKLRKARRNVIGFIGGSITTGAKSDGLAYSWPKLVFNWFETTFPETKLDYVNAAIGATGTNFGAHRVQADLLDRDPDVVFVEFAVNDPRTPECRETLEGMLRQILKSRNKPAVMMLFTMTVGGNNAQQWHAEIGAHYAIPMVSFRDAYWPEVHAGRVKWEDIIADIVHPNRKGHACCADLVVSQLEQLLADFPGGSAPPRIAPLPAPVTDNAFEFTAMFTADTLPAAANKGWTVVDKGAAARFGKGWAADKPGSVLEFDIEGRLFTLVFHRIKADMGGIAVRVDDGKPVPTDAWFDQTWGGYSACVTMPRVAPGKHRVRIELLQDKANESGGHRFELQAVLAAGTKRD